MQPAIAEQFLTDAQRWNALAKRDRQADGAFFYAVTTTGVYCRPACASRLPNRPNVRFFPTCAEAEQAGFRPCKRCQPNATAPQAAQVQLIAQICKQIEAETSLSLSDLATAAGLSQYHLQRLFKAIVGVTPKAYAIAQREKQVRDRLQSDASVIRTLYEAGFGASSQFYSGVTQRLGMVPSQYKSGAAKIEIRFAIARSSLGWVLVAATERGICAIELGDTPEVLSERLQARFPPRPMAGIRSNLF